MYDLPFQHPQGSKTNLQLQGRDAARCVDYLARIGKEGRTCVVSGGYTQMCHDGNAVIVGSKANSRDQSANW